MNFLSSAVSSLAVLSVVSACSATGGVSPSDDKPVPVKRAAASYPVLPPSDYNIEFTLKNSQIDSSLMMNESLPKVRFIVWGFDEMVADVAATKITSSEFDLRPAAESYPLRFSKEDLEKIEFTSGSPETMKYYITLEVDVDLDGEVCNGDYRQNYELSRPEFYQVTRTEIERVLDIAIIWGEVCGDETAA